VIEIAEGAGWPEPLTEFLARDQVARLFQQQRQNLEGLFLKIDPDARFSQLARPAIQLKNAKSDNTLGRDHLWHASSSAPRSWKSARS
jgi:hypothetical protein